MAEMEIPHTRHNSPAENGLSFPYTIIRCRQDNRYGITRIVMLYGLSVHVIIVTFFSPDDVLSFPDDN